MHKPKSEDVWDFFDCNQDLNRCFKEQEVKNASAKAKAKADAKATGQEVGKGKRDKGKGKGKGKEGQDDKPGKRRVTNPWRTDIPTLVGSSIICGRVVRPGSSEPTFRRVHGLEAMRLMGWDLCMYAGGQAFDDKDQSPELLQSLAGNAWCQWHCVPLLLSVLGSVDWAKAGTGSRTGATASTGAVPSSESAGGDSDTDEDDSD